MKKLITAAFVFFFALAANAQINSVTPSASKVKQYDAIFFEVALTGEWDNPYLQEEAALDMVLTLRSLLLQSLL